MSESNPIQPAIEPAVPVAATTPAPAPSAAVTADPQPAASPTFGAYLKDNVPNHLKVLAVVGAVALSWIAVNKIRDLQAELKAQAQITATLSQRYQAIGSSALSGNSTASAPSVQQQTSDAFGPAVLEIMRQQGSQISSLTTAIGMTNAQVTALKAPATPFTAQQQSAVTGQLSGYRIEESRLGAPPLSSVNLFYNPAEHDSSKAFAGTMWTHNQEKFETSVGEWVKGKDGGMSTTLRLRRTVSKPDPLNPTQTIEAGTEDIPITGSNTVYTPKGLVVGTPLVMPRWTLDLGLTKTANLNKSSGTSVATTGIGAYGSLDYRVTNRYGVFLGTANSGVVGGISIRLDSK